MDSKTDNNEKGGMNLLYKILKVNDETVKTTAKLEAAVAQVTKTFSVDAHAPAAVAERIAASGVTKSKLNTMSTVLLGIMAGLFIGFGAVFCTIVGTNSGLSFGMAKLVGGLAFCLGLILVVIAGAELFTGNNLIVVGWLNKKVSLGGLLRNWGIVYTSNLVGSLLLVGLMFFSEQYTFSGNAVGVNSLNIANAKVNLSFSTALVRGILCNVLVCLAVWLCFSARTVVDKVLAIIFPVTAFVAAGFEHSVANMYFIPMGILMSGQPAVVEAAGVSQEALSNLTWGGFLGNLVPVTIGNIIGGVAVAVVYWAAYMRKKEAAPVQKAERKPWMKNDKDFFERLAENPAEALKEYDHLSDDEKQAISHYMESKLRKI